jgi:hypothetical protein
VKHQTLVSILLFSAVATTSVSVSAYAQSAAAIQPLQTGTLRVRLTCSGCDVDFLKTSVGFVEFTADAAGADVDVVASRAEAADRRWRVTFVGRGRFAGRDRVLSFSPALLATPNDVGRELARVLRIGLVEYAVEMAAGPQLDVAIRPVSAAPSLQVVYIEGPDLKVTVRGGPTGAAAPKDRWNYWVFHISGETYGDGERLSSNRSYEASASANRTTANWKVRIGGSRSLDRSSFTVSDDETITTRLSDWRADSLIVRSLGPHFSLAAGSSIGSSTFANEKRAARVSTGVEYDLFPYAESTRRSLTIQYLAGQTYYEFAAETVFGKLTEKVAHHTLNVSLGLRQPWGQAGSTFVFTQQLRELDRTRTTFLGNVSVRLTRHFSLTGSGTYARIRDQFTLEKGEATEEEVLLRQRQLATGHRYSVSAGVAFSFGALSSATVNPRFGF